MRDNDRLHVAMFLDDLNDRAAYAVKYHSLKKDSYLPLTCKMLAEKCEVTPATISNLSTHSNFYLLYRVSEEILDAYFAYFEYDERQTRKDYPDDSIMPRDKTYVLYQLTEYYSEEFLEYT